MARLIETGPLTGLLPRAAGTVHLTAAAEAQLTSVAPFAGQAVAVDAALAPLGLAFPAPGQVIEAGPSAGQACRMIWTGRDQAFLIGADAPSALTGCAALTDQTDGWAVMDLDGAGAVDVLARLVPADLRAVSFAPGQVVRTSLGHMMLILHRRGVLAFRLMVFRSMAGTAVHEIDVAMRAVAARAALTATPGPRRD